MRSPRRLLRTQTNEEHALLSAVQRPIRLPVSASALNVPWKTAQLVSHREPNRMIVQETQRMMADR